MSEKTEEPTPRRLAKAREKGDVGASAFASQALGFAVAVVLGPAAILTAATRAETMLRSALETRGAGWSPGSLAMEVVGIVLPLLLAVAAASAVATVVQTGALFAPARVAPDLSRLDPIGGLGGLLGRQRLWAVGRALATAVVVGWLCARGLQRHAGDLANAIGGPAKASLVAGTVAGQLARATAALGIAVALVDVIVTRRAHLAKLRMSRAEVQREHRESEGDPQLKAARERAHHEMLAAATVNAVREATVVIVNPRHVATALRYLDGEDEAPTIVASGDGDLARRIQDAARAWGIPIVRDVPVARALRELEVGDQIPEALYEAVAEILREVWTAEEADEGGASSGRPAAT